MMGAYSSKNRSMNVPHEYAVFIGLNQCGRYGIARFDVATLDIIYAHKK